MKLSKNISVLLLCCGASILAMDNQDEIFKKMFINDICINRLNRLNIATSPLYDNENNLIIDCDNKSDESFDSDKRIVLPYENKLHRDENDMLALRLEEETIGDNELQDLFHLFSKHSDIHYIVLQNNSYKGRAFHNLINMISMLTQLEGLKIKKSKLFYSRCCTLAGLLNSMSTLEYLNLSRCEISYHSCVVIANTLRNNRSLLKVLLRSNDITNASIPVINALMHDNTVLTTLDLRGNDIRWGSTNFGQLHDGRLRLDGDRCCCYYCCIV